MTLLQPVQHLGYPAAHRLVGDDTEIGNDE